MSLIGNNKKGFTLVELLVSLGIAGVILTVVAYGQSKYTQRLSLTQYADNIASSALEAQTYGIAVKEVVPGSANFSAPYGVMVSVLSDVEREAFLTFVDLNDNTVYDAPWACFTGEGQECLEKREFAWGNLTNKICSITSSGEDCSTPRRVDISYKRPSIEPRFAFFNSLGTVYSVSGVLGVRIELISPEGETRSVAIYKNGQIAVQ